MNQLFSTLKGVSKPVKMVAGIASCVTSIAVICLLCIVISFLTTPSVTPTPAQKEITTKVLITSAISPSLTIQATRTTAPTITIAPTATDFKITPPPTSTVGPTFTCITSPSPQIGKVIEIVDGDTIKVLIEGMVYPVRYIGIDTPENTFKNEVYGKEASNKNSTLVLGKIVQLYRDVSETDSFNRLLRYVLADGIFVNYELVITGFAQAKDYPPDTSCSRIFHEAELIAQSERIGLWSGIIPIPIPAPFSFAVFPTSTSTATGNASGSIIILAVYKQAEYVIIKNTGQTSVNLSGWTLVSEKGNQVCILGGSIKPVSELKIWAQVGDGTGFACNFSGPIWNNSAIDPAVLYNPSGNEVSRK